MSVIPPIDIYRNTLLILVGISGAGKSTFAKKYFLNSMIVSTDVCRQLVCDSQTNQRFSEDAFDLFYFILEKRLKNGFPAIADSTALRIKYRKKLINIANTCHVHTMACIFDIPMDVCFANNRNRNRFVYEDIIRQQKIYFERAKIDILQESYDLVLTFHSIDEINNFIYRWIPAKNKENAITMASNTTSIRYCCDM